MAQLLEYKFDADRIEEYVKSLINVDNVVITAQFGSFVNGFTHAISRSEYDRLLAYYSEGYPVQTVEFEEIVSARGRPYFVISMDGKLYSSSKDILRRQDVPELGIRIIVSAGERREVKNRPEPNFIRTKTTTTIDLGSYKIHVTKSVQGIQIRYELEIELPFTSIDRLSEILSSVTRILKGSEMALTLEQVDRAYLILNDALGGPECVGKICANIVPRPRNIKTSDISHTGVVPVGDSPNYFASPKADGVNTFLVMDRGTYLIHGSVVNKVSELSPFKVVIQGELVKDTLYVFDILKIGDEYLRDAVYSERLKRFEDIDLSQIPFRVVMKRTVEITRRNFYIANNSILEGDYEFNIDGIIYTPNNQYNVIFQKPILKWKPPEQLTIDFVVAGGELHTSKGIFRGTPEHPYEPNFNRPELDGIIAEFEYKNEEFVLLRERPDKLFPNSQILAEEVWSNIMDPITTEFMTGQTFTIMLEYIKARKKMLLGGDRTIILLGPNAFDDYDVYEGLDVIHVTEDGSHVPGIRGIELDIYDDIEGLEELSKAYPDALVVVDTPSVLPAGLMMFKERGHEIIIFAIDGASVLAMPPNPMISLTDGDWWELDIPGVSGTGEIIDFVPVVEELNAKITPLDYDFLTVSERELLSIFRFIQ